MTLRRNVSLWCFLEGTETQELPSLCLSNILTFSLPVKLSVKLNHSQMGCWQFPHAADSLGQIYPFWLFKCQKSLQNISVYIWLVLTGLKTRLHSDGSVEDTSVSSFILLYLVKKNISDYPHILMPGVLWVSFIHLHYTTVRCLQHDYRQMSGAFFHHRSDVKYFLHSVFPNRCILVIMGCPVSPV